MKSTSALKLACLSAGLATAWSPLGGQMAKADTVVDVHFNMGNSSVDIGTYSSVAMGLVFSDPSHTFEVHDLGSFVGQHSYDTSFNTAEDIANVTGYVTAGFATDGHVMLSIGSLNALNPFNWDTLFSPITVSNAASNLDAFLNTILASPLSDTVQNNVLQISLYDTTNLYEFIDGTTTVSEKSGDVAIDLTATAVPLPSACLMGGALFALMVLSKHSVKWIHLHRTQGLA